MESSPPSAVNITIENGLADHTELSFVNRFHIGRPPGCQLRVDHHEVSRYHVDVFVKEVKTNIAKWKSTRRVISKYRSRVPNETYDTVFSIFSAAVIAENPRLFGYDFDNPLASRKIAYMNAKSTI